MSLLKAESYKKGIISSTLFNIGAKGLGFINSMLIIYIFGAGVHTDIYFLVLATATLLTSFINGIDLLILIPEAMRIRSNEGIEEEKSFLNYFIFLYLLIGLAIALVILVAPIFFYAFFSKFDDPSLRSQQVMLLLSSILMPLQLLNSLFVSILTSHRYFTVPMIVSVVNSIISITVLILLKDKLSITSAVIALTIGYTVNFVWLVITLRRKLEWNFMGKRKTPSRKLFGNIGLMQINILPITLRSYLIVLLLSGIGAGVITSLNYGQQLSNIPEMLILTQIVAVVGIKFNELSSTRDEKGLNKLFADTMNMMMIITLPIAFLMALLSNEIVIEIFRYTRKVNAETIDYVATIVFFLGLSLPARSLDMIMTRVLTSQQKIRQGVLYAIIVHSLITLFVYIGIITFGLKGFLVAFLVGHSLMLPIVFYFLIKRVAPFIEYTRWIVNALPFIGFNLVLAFLLFLGKRYFLYDMPLVNIFIISGVYLVCVMVFNYYSNFYSPVNTVIKKLIHRK
jgi:putative peptidoglycan lipid II flippase